MHRSIITVFSLCFICLFSGCDPDDQKNELELSYIRVGTISLTIDETMDADIPVTREIYIAFDEPLDPGSVDNAFKITTPSTQVAVSFTYDLVDNNAAISITLDSELASNTVYTIELTNALRSSKGGRFQAQSFDFKTEVGELKIESWAVNTVPVVTERIEDVPQDLSFTLTFSSPLNTGTVCWVSGDSLKIFESPRL